MIAISFSNLHLLIHVKQTFPVSPLDGKELITYFLKITYHTLKDCYYPAFFLFGIIPIPSTFFPPQVLSLRDRITLVAAL